jgi:uncharacterized protein (PEP-CTERM system associated)
MAAMAMAAKLSVRNGRKLAAVALVIAATTSVHAVDGIEAPQSSQAPAAESGNASQAAGEQARRGGWTVTPLIGVTGTYTDNVTLAASGLERSDFVTEIKPGIRIRGLGARVKLSLDYELQKFFYARNSAYDRTQNALSGIGSVEAVEKFFYIDARAVISQQSTNPLGPQPVSNATFTTNRTESRLFSLSPYVKGEFGNFANYEVRHTATRTSNDSNTALGDSRSKDWIARARNSVPLANFGWALDYSNRTFTFGSSESELESAKATLIYQFDPQFRASINAGHEKNDFVIGSQSYSNRGFGFEWRPTPRTVVTGQQDKRFFGTGYNYRFNHRTPLSSWSLGYLKDVTTFSDQLQADIPSQAYSFWFSNPNMIALYPNVSDRDLAVRQLLAQLGLPASAGNQTFLANRAFLSKRVDASVALFGARNTLTFTVSRSENSAASVASGADVFSASSNVRQTAFSGSWSHKISAISTLNLLASQTRSEGSAPVTQKNTQRLINLSLTHKLGPKTLGSLGLRRVSFDAEGGAQNSYDENALTGSLSVTF